LFRSPEQRDFFEKILAHVRAPEQSRSFAKGLDGPLLLEGGAGLGKTRAALMAAAEIVRSGLSVAIVLPSADLMQRVLDSGDFADVIPADLDWLAFRPAAAGSTPEEIEQAADAAREVPLLFCTAGSVINDRLLRGRYNGATSRDYLIFDDADRLPDGALRGTDCEVTASQLRELGVVGSSVRDVATRVSRAPAASQEARAAATMILETLDDPAKYHSVTFNPEVGLALRHRMPGRLMKRVANNPNAAFIGKSLSLGRSFDAFKRAMGIVSPSGLSSIIEPKNHGSLRCHHAAHAPLSEEWFAVLKQGIAKAARLCLVVTADDQQAKAIGLLTPGASIRLSGDAYSSEDLLPPDESVLIAAANWRGLDAPREWRSIIIARIPIDAEWGQDEDADDHFVDPRNQAIRLLKNIIGWGIRRPDAECDLYVIDHRSGLVESLIPARFKGEWTQRRTMAGRGAAEDSAIERLIAAEQPGKSLRDEVFRVLGKRCMTCDLVPKPGIPLEIHLLGPVSVSEDERSLAEEMAVLCQSCHRLAHSATPPLSMDMLRGFHARKRERT
jgi:hypothetical protein